MLLGCGQEGGRLVKVLLDINPFPRFSVNWCQEASATRYVSLWGEGGAFSERIPPGQYGGRKRERKEERREGGEMGEREGRGKRRRARWGQRKGETGQDEEEAGERKVAVVLVSQK